MGISAIIERLNILNESSKPTWHWLNTFIRYDWPQTILFLIVLNSFEILDDSDFPGTAYATFPSNVSVKMPTV